MHNTGVNMPAIHTPQTTQDFDATLKRLMPLEPQGGWKGRVVSICDSIKSKYTQIIELFKTGKWSVEDQIRVKVNRELATVEKITSQWVEKMKTRFSGPKALEYDSQMRERYAARLDQMHYLVKAVLQVKPNDKQLSNLEMQIDNERKNNSEILKNDKKILERAKKGKSVFEQTAAWAANIAECKKGAAYEKRADQLIAERSIHMPVSEGDFFEVSAVRDLVEDKNNIRAMLNKQVPINEEYLESVRNRIDEVDLNDLSKNGRRIVADLKKKLAAAERMADVESEKNSVKDVKLIENAAKDIKAAASKFLHGDETEAKKNEEAAEQAAARIFDDIDDAEKTTPKAEQFDIFGAFNSSDKDVLKKKEKKSPTASDERKPAATIEDMRKQHGQWVGPRMPRVSFDQPPIDLELIRKDLGLEPAKDLDQLMDDLSLTKEPLPTSTTPLDDLINTLEKTEIEKKPTSQRLTRSNLMSRG